MNETKFMNENEIICSELRMPTNIDLAKERAGGSFNPDDITRVLYGKDGMHRRRLAREY